MNSSTESSKGFESRVAGYRQRVEQMTTEFVAARTADDTLGAATRYAIATEGKRIRPLLAYATAEMLGVDTLTADFPAAAIEMLHTYSLVHDDLPAMDDDDLRRGRPTVHKQFDEATGILVGDALLTFAFELLASAAVDADVRANWVSMLARAGGGQGMIQGQATDLAGEQSQLGLSQLEQMHRQKSGALIEVSMNMIAAVQPGVDSRGLSDFGHHIGLAFQIRDDILDVTSSTETLGKPEGSDALNNKSTFVSLLGIQGAMEKLDQERDAADAALATFGEQAEGLRWLSNYIVARDY